MTKFTSKNHSGKKQSLREKYSKKKTKFDPKSAIKKHKLTHKESYKINTPQKMSIRTKEGNVEVELIPATWKTVFIYALINAILIFFVRIIWFDFFGKPSKSFITPSNEASFRE